MKRRHRLLSPVDPAKSDRIRPCAKALCIAVAFACSGLAHADLASDLAPDGRYFAKGRLLVQTRIGLSDVEVDKALKGHGAKRKGKIDKIGVHIIELPEKANEMAVAKAMRNNPHFEAVELDYAYEPEMTVNDTYFGNAWHLPKIGVTTAWDSASSSGPTIAILDSGVNGSHPDLGAQMVPGWNFYSNNADTSDVYGHGTKVAGSAAAAGNNALGVVGVSFRSKIMPIRVTDTAGYGYTSAMANGIRWAADNGAKVANLSFRNVAGDSIIINAANYMRSKGGVVVAAGGNTGGQLVLAASNAITAVAATNSADSRTSWSSWGDHIDVSAPGEGIWVTTMSGGYGAASGTSFASPVTAGVYALMMTANSSLTPAQLDAVLFSTAVDINAAGFDVYTGYGRINAAAAVQKSKTTVASDTQAPSAAISAPTGGKVSGTVPVDVSATDNIEVVRVDLLVDGKVVLSDSAPPYSFSWSTTGLADGSKQLQAKSYDAAGNVGTSSSVAVTVANDTVAPTVTITNPANGSTVSGDMAITVLATDNVKVAKLSLLIDGKEVAVVLNGGTLSYTLNASTTTTRTKPKRGKNTTSTTTAVATTSSTIVAKAEDPAGNVSSTSITIKR